MYNNLKKHVEVEREKEDPIHSWKIEWLADATEKYWKGTEETYQKRYYQDEDYEKI